MFQTSTLSVPGSSNIASSGNNLQKLSQMTISQIISGSTQALNQWLNNQDITENNSCGNTSTNSNNTNPTPTLANGVQVATNSTTANNHFLYAPITPMNAPITPMNAPITSMNAPITSMNAPITSMNVPVKTEGFDSMYIYDTQSMNSYAEQTSGINKKKYNLSSCPGDYTIDSYKILSYSNEVQPNTYEQMEIENKVKYWEKNQDKLSVANSTNLKSWSQYA